MIDSQKRGLLTLVRAALTGEKQALPEDFRLEDALEAIVKHSIVVMALEGALKCGVPRSDPTVVKLLRRAFNAMGLVEAQDKTAAKIFAAFEEAKIGFMPVKGAVLRDLYPKREYRSMGDMDVLIHMEQYPQIRSILAGMGFEEKSETDHELVWNCGDLYLELHKRLIPSYNGGIYQYYGDGWQLARPGGACRHEMTAEDHFVYVFAHMAKHYRDGGVGIRHMCDLWVLRTRYPDMDEAYIRRELGKMGLLAFYENVLQMLDAWFDGGAFTDKSEFITEVVYESGAFGKAREHFLAIGARLAGEKQATGLTRYKRIWDRVFLNRKDMEIKYPVLRRAPALLPLMWAYRGIYIALRQPHKIRREQEAFRMLTQEDIDSYQQSLHFVGLKYD